MKSIETNIIINASVEKVWNTLMQFEDYPNWNPFIQSITGKAQKGAKLQVAIHPPEKSAMNFHPVILVHAPNKEFRWLGKLGISGIFDGEHYFQLKAIDPHHTALIHGEKFSGLLVGFIFKMMQESTLKGFQSMNVALKEHCEK